MPVIGVTGPIGSGKSLVREYFRLQGAEVIDVDREAHRYLQPGESTYNKIITEFGKTILNKDGTINRSLLGQIVFSSEKKLALLNSIVHPPLVEDLKKRIRNFRRHKDKGLLVVDAALLFQWKLEELCDRVIWLDAPEEVRKQRMVEQRQLSPEAFDRRNAAQKRMFSEHSTNEIVVKVINSNEKSKLEESIQRILEKVVNHEK